MSSNWSPWWFLNAEIVLEGDEKPLPSPTMRGRLVHCALRQVANDRITGDAVWRDESGGLLRASYTGWRGEDVFGMALRYLPPPGRTVASLRWVLTAQPYDYSDRGYWQRQRWLSSPTGTLNIPEEPLALAADEWRVVLHNRYAHLTSGCVLAMNAGQLAEATIRHLDQKRVEVALTPVRPGEQVALVLGDWVGDYWQARAREFFSRETAEMQALLADAAPEALAHEALQVSIEVAAARREQIARERAERALRLAEREWE
jgi:hypothetical protein